jgi:hypothetical protein
MSVSHTGIKQSALPTITNSLVDQPVTGSQAITLTTAGVRGWGVVFTRSGTTLSAGSGQTSRATNNSSTNMLGDTNGNYTSGANITSNTSGDSTIPQLAVFIEDVDQSPRVGSMLHMFQ